MPATAKPFVFICGPDDFLVGRLGRARFDALADEGGADEFAREIVNGFANNVDDVATAVNRFRDAVQTMPMFGGRRVVWLKDVNFLEDSVTGRAEGTLEQVAALQELLERVDPAETSVVVTAAPVDRRRSFPKWCESHADFTVTGGEGGDALIGVALAEARELNAKFDGHAAELLVGRVGNNPRLLTEEVRKLATHAGAAPAPEAAVTITEEEVSDLTANTAEGDFFEAADAFSAGNLAATLRALQRHFFAGGDARPVLAALQNRNRLLTQARVLLDAGEIRVGGFGVDKASLARAQEAHAPAFGGDTEKSSYNVFTQNAWYLGKLMGGKLPPLRRLIDNQQEFVRAFEQIVQRPHEQEAMLREMVSRCLA
ncbi:MAG TPA: DNA polymerase III subunit delta [Candidatus Didemnitutus sp.]